MMSTLLKKTQYIFLIFGLASLFILNAQEVRVIDNKGTIQNIRNNQVTVDTTQPSDPVEGDVWYNTSTTPITVNIWDEPSDTWEPVPNQFWSLTGNSLTNPATNFLGTIDPVDLIFRAGNIEKLRIVGNNGQLLVNQAPVFNNHPLVIRANGVDVLAFQDNTGVPRWHWNLLSNGLNFVESNVLDFRLFLENGGNVGINTNDPTERLDVNGKLRVRDIETVATDLDVLISTTDGVVQKKPLLAAETDNQLALGANGGVYLAAANSGPLNVQTQTIGYTFAAGLTQGNNGTNLFNINSSVTRTNVGRYSVVLTTPHPNGASYSIVLGVEEDNGNRDGRIIQVVDNSQTTNGFDVMILTGDNGGTADGYVDENWSFEVAAEISVVTSVTQGTTPPTGGATPTGTPATGFNLNNFGDAGNFELSFTTGNNGGSTWEVLITDRPYATLPSLTAIVNNVNPVAVSVTSQDNGNGTYNHLITSTTPLPPNNPSVTVSGGPTGGGAGTQNGGPCTCISFFVN